MDATGMTTTREIANRYNADNSVDDDGRRRLEMGEGEGIHFGGNGWLVAGDVIPPGGGVPLRWGDYEERRLLM